MKHALAAITLAALLLAGCVETETSALPAAPVDEFFIADINPAFMGVYLPYNYIAALTASRNHCRSLFHEGRGAYHDILEVTEYRIFSNSRFNDGYAIEAEAGNLFQFIEDEHGKKIIDTNGYVYRKIWDSSFRKYRAVENFIAGIVLRELLIAHPEISIAGGRVTLPMLYAITGEDTFNINISTNFFERGLNLLLQSANRDNRFNLALVIDENGHHFYRMGRHPDYFMTIRSYIVLSFTAPQAAARELNAPLSVKDNYG